MVDINLKIDPNQAFLSTTKAFFELCDKENFIND